MYRVVLRFTKIMIVAPVLAKEAAFLGTDCSRKNLCSHDGDPQFKLLGDVLLKYDRCIPDRLIPCCVSSVHRISKARNVLYIPGCRQHGCMFGNDLAVALLVKLDEALWVIGHGRSGDSKPQLACNGELVQFVVGLLCL